MPAPLRTQLTSDEIATLSILRTASEVPYRVRDRAHMLLLNADSWSVTAIANMYQCHEHTVRAALNHWKHEGLYGLWEKEGRGQKRTWQASDLEYLEQCLGEEERTYNSSQLAHKLWEERRVKLSADRVRRLLKKRAIGGNARARATEIGKTLPPKLSPKENSSS